MIRECTVADLAEIGVVINDAAEAYRGVIAADRWRDPYMSLDELRAEVDAGVVFWALEEDGRLEAVMGLQHVADVALIRHAYTRPARQGQGIGRALLEHLRALTDRPMLVGTWVAATWAVRFYRARGFALVTPDEKDKLLRRYWTVPDRQIQESVVLVDAKWGTRARPNGHLVLGRRRPGGSDGQMDLSVEDYGAHLAHTLRLAHRSLASGNFPVGATIVSRDGRVLGSGSNQSQSSRSPIAHAELRAINRARRRLATEEPGSAILITSAEPCLMCLGAVLHSPALGTIVWAAGSAGPTGSALAAVRASGYNRGRVELLRAVPEPSPTARRESRRLLYQWCAERSDPRAPWFADDPPEPGGQ